jgi:hypothetical protein
MLGQVNLILTADLCVAGSVSLQLASVSSHINYCALFILLEIRAGHSVRLSGYVRVIYK